jgi:metal-sulfur cluster biosynthetic enzyme
MMHGEKNLSENIYLLLKQVIDPEIGLNIVDLGLVYEVALPEDKLIQITMTLTTPGCPMGKSIMHAVTNLLNHHYPEFKITANLVWLPMWDASMISEAGQAHMNGGYQPQNHGHSHESLWDRFF